jgi:hypothetical protein
MKAPADWSYKQRVFVLIIILTALRLIIAFTVELGNDESYYWLYGQQLKWNYFDHPPMVAVWIKIFTLNLSLEQYTGFLRLGSVVGCAVSTWFMYKCVTVLSTERAGWFAACLYNASFYAGINAGIFIIPDAPQMVFWTLSLWMLARITTDEKKWLNWIIFGISSGICIMSKVHGVFLWIGLGLYILFYKRTWLANPRLYFALIISFAISTPILIWNIQNNFVTYSFNSQRIDIVGFSRNWYSFLRQACGQLLINNPFNVVIIFLALLTWRHHKMKRMPALTIFNFAGLLLASVILFISLYRDDTLPHWSGPGYVSLIPLAAIWLSVRNKTSIFPRPLYLSVGGHVAFLILCTLAIHNYPGNFGSKSPKDLGTGDITLDMYGWKEAGIQFDSIYQSDMSKGIIQPGTPVVCYKWWGAHQEYYFCRPFGIQMMGLGDMLNLHEYMWMNAKRKDKVNFTSAYCIEPSDELYDVRSQYKNYYSTIDSVANIKISRGNEPAHNFYIYRLTGWKNNLPTAP